MEVMNNNTIAKTLVNLELIKYLEDRVRARLSYEFFGEVIEVKEPEVKEDGTFLSRKTI